MNPSPQRRPNLSIMHPDPILRSGLVAALRQHGGFEIFIHGVDDLAPGGPPIDVVIADYRNALRLTDAKARRSDGLQAGTRILVLTSNDREADIRRAIESGVYGYLLFGGPLAELIDGVTAVTSGVRYMSAAAARRMADSLTRAALTSRENEVLRLVADGQSNKSIARELAIELGTVKSHMSAIMTKLGAGSRTEAARIAASRGLIDDHHEVVPRLQPVLRAPMEPMLRYA
ncbi:response regulator transcription factor [Variovorax sp. JS1663]|uniref:response regulator transcription factor n=1 Tax=Variovorax sp. JS1663 TaxID=1851577 RepID=UPI000B34637E|nr:response regulator transcription factor [Variovorax sp. JS1663]OUM02847.1 hypothetical protein A8M77_09640 [Variovorax sp. JS1663]